MITGDHLIEFIEFKEKLNHIPNGRLFVETYQICQDKSVLHKVTAAP